MRLLIVRHGIAMTREDFRARSREPGPGDSREPVGDFEIGAIHGTEAPVIGRGRRPTGSARRIERLAQHVPENDDLRPLTEEGGRKMRKNAKGLRSLIPRPDVLVTSPLTRARETAEILCDVWRGIDVVSTDLLRPGSDPSALMKWLLEPSLLPLAAPSSAAPGRKKETRDVTGPFVCLVGHEPHLSSFASWLTSGRSASQIVLKKGGAGLFSVPKNFAPGRVVLEWLATPSMLRAFR